MKSKNKKPRKNQGHSPKKGGLSASTLERGIPGAPGNRKKEKICGTRADYIIIDDPIPPKTGPEPSGASKRGKAPPPEETPPQHEKTDGMGGFWDEPEEEEEVPEVETPSKEESMREMLARHRVPPKASTRLLSEKEKFGDAPFDPEAFKTRPLPEPMTETSKDRSGYTYKELLAEQKTQLAKWKRLLTEQTYKKLEARVQKLNSVGNAQPWPEGRHRVPRGYEIVQILFEIIPH